MSLAATPARVLAVLRGARQRVAAGFAMGGCVCCQREENDTPVRAKYPPAEGQTWCFLCAVEAEQRTLRIDGDAFGLALAEIAFVTSGRRFTLYEFCARDEVLFPAFEAADQAAALDLFDRAIAAMQVPA